MDDHVKERILTIAEHMVNKLMEAFVKAEEDMIVKRDPAMTQFLFNLVLTTMNRMRPGTTSADAEDPMWFEKLSAELEMRLRVDTDEEVEHTH